jgi:predicted enzyme related to lactoylglutathione lyase
MGERDGYRPGQFCWVDLATTDQDAAKKFYGELLGWSANDMEIPDSGGTVYSMMEVDGKQVCAISPQPEQQRDAGVPPAWNNYVWVEDADATAARATELGANVHAPPFDVLTAGRMAVIQDPQGAFFMLWQAKDQKGAQLVNEVGALTWNELATQDPDASQSFYEGLFGWDVKDTGRTDPPYRMIHNGDEINGGMVTPPDKNMPSFWLPYFGVDDVEASLAKIEDLGGTRLMGPMEIETPASGPGHIGAAQDPQGAYFAVYAGGYQD